MATMGSGASGLGGAGGSGEGGSMISVSIHAKDAAALKKAVAELKKLVSGGEGDDEGEETQTAA